MGDQLQLLHGAGRTNALPWHFRARDPCLVLLLPSLPNRAWQKDCRIGSFVDTSTRSSPCPGRLSMIDPVSSVTFIVYGGSPQNRSHGGMEAKRSEGRGCGMARHGRKKKCWVVGCRPNGTPQTPPIHGRPLPTRVLYIVIHTPQSCRREKGHVGNNTSGRDALRFAPSPGLPTSRPLAFATNTKRQEP